tara:strand:- start:89 stop:337 length:249 start_codon:yes stop_codon:yes gene_type:complete
MNGKGDKWRGGWSKEYESNHNDIFKKEKQMIKVIVEDYNGDYLCSFDSKEVKNLKNCDIADIDTDENGIKYIRVQLTEDRSE